MTSGRLQGKIALITGTGSGQGRAAALRFAREGAIVVGCGRTAGPADETVRMVTEQGGSMVSLAPVDLSKEDDVRRWIDFAVAEFGGFDILYNNASACVFAPIEEMTLAEWDYTIKNELTLIFLTVKAAVPIFRQRGGGVILNTSSVAGLRPGGSGGFAHCAAKAGVNALTTSLAVELAPDGVRVNVISPGFVETSGVATVIEFAGREAIAHTALNHRIGQPEDVAASAVHLCSDEAIHITGANLVVDGGGAVAPGNGRAPAEPIRFTFN